MAEEFADFIKQANKKSLEEQVIELQTGVGKLINITEKFIKYYDMELSKITNKMIKLETEQMRGKLPKIEVLIPPPPAPPNTRPIGDENVRVDVMGELKGLFKKHGENNLKIMERDP